MKKALCFLVLVLVLAACSPAQDFQGKNPKDADVVIENGVVTITISISTPYFRLQKVKDDSVSYAEIFFQYDSEEGGFVYRTDLDEWKPVPPDEDKISMGQVVIEVGEKDIVITYPSGTWAFP